MRIAFDYGGVLSKRSDVWVPMIDDSPGYCAAASESCVSLMVWPDPERHYDNGIEEL